MNDVILSLSVVTLNVSVLNSLIKRQRVAEWILKIMQPMLFMKDSP